MIRFLTLPCCVSTDVAGAAALLLQADGSKTGAAASVALVEMASSGKVIDPRTGSPNKLLYVGEISGSGPNPAPAPGPAPAPTPSSGANVEISVSFDDFPEENTGCRVLLILKISTEEKSKL